MGPTMYELAGGAPGIHRLAERFYELVFADELLAPLFREPGEEHANRLALWLIELLGGPPEHTQARGGFEVMRGSHVGLEISEAQRSRWAALMEQACADTGMSAEFRRRFVPYVEGGSTYAMRVSWPADRIWPR